MTKKERLNKIFPILEKKFGKPKCALNFETPFQLMVAVILSAQCTDERVNNSFVTIFTLSSVHCADKITATIN